MTILIKGVQILSAGERLKDKSDILISGEKISAVGNFPTKIADRIIDGQGCFVSPGFIDLNTDSDHYLSIFNNRSQSDFIRQGVTTIVGGQCGSSLAPLIYGNLDSIRKWIGVSRFNVNWHEVRELLKIMDSRPLGVNFATLVGHSTIRRDIIGEEIRDLTANELMVFIHTLKNAMDQGAFGLSSGLGYIHCARTPIQELEYLVNVVREKNGIYTTHLREAGSGLSQAVDETIGLARKTGVKTIINHFIPEKGNEAVYRRSLEKIEELSKRVELYFNIAPFAINILPLYMLLPLWVRKGNLESMFVQIEDEWLGGKIAKEINIPDPQNIIVSRAEGNEFLVGRSLKDCMDIYETREPGKALLKIMLATHLRASIFYENLNIDLIIEAMSNSRCLIASNAASLSKEKDVVLVPERARRTFPKFISLVEEKHIMPIEKAIQRLTEIPARLLNLKNRGVIKEGYYADLVGFRGSEIIFTIVNGKIVFENRNLHNGCFGKIMRHVKS